MATVSKLIELSLAEFGESVAGASAAPAGGAVSAALGLLATGLVSMAFRHGAREGGSENPLYMAGRADELDALRRRFGELVDADASAYGAFREAEAMPPSDERAKALEKALAASIELPVEMAEAAIGTLRLVLVGAPHTDAAHGPDLALAIDALATAGDGALGLARANVARLADPVAAKEERERLDFLGKQLGELAGKARGRLAGGAA